MPTLRGAQGWRAAVLPRTIALALVLFAAVLVVTQSPARAQSDKLEVSGTTSTLDPGMTTCKLHGHHLVGCETTRFVTGFSGTLVGSSSTDSRALINCKTRRYHGNGIETFTGSVTGVGSGTLTMRLHVSGDVTADCSDLTSFEGKAVVVAGTGDLAGLNGTLRFEGSTYSGSLH
jgi:hypothetical protein